MKFLDLAGVQQFKDYNDSKYVVTEDVVDLTAGSLDFYTKGEIDEMLEDFNPELTETDPVFTASAASGITSTDISNWNSKQDAISDLATIRSNAADGAAKVSNVQADWNATSGLAQILHKPTIPAEVTESTVSGWGFTKNAGTITGITMNGASKGTSGVIDLGTVMTSHQDISGKADKSAAIGSLSLSLDSTNYKITLSGTKVDGTTFTVSDVIDLPLESVVVNGSYNNTTKKVVLTLQNGNTVDFSVADLVSGLQSEITSTNKLSADLISDGTTNKTVTATEKSTWNGKQDAISDLATIRSNAEAGAAKVSNVQSDWNATSGLAQILNKPTIPAAVTESTVSGWGFTKNTGTLTGVSFNGVDASVTNGVASITADLDSTYIVHVTTDGGGYTIDNEQHSASADHYYSDIANAYSNGKVLIADFNGILLPHIYISESDQQVQFGTTVSQLSILININSNSANYIANRSITSETDPVFSASAAARITSSDITNWNNKTSNTGTVTQVKVGNTAYNPSSGVISLPAYPARAVELYKFNINDIDNLSDFTSVSSSTYNSIKAAIGASKIVVLMFSTQDPYNSYFILDTDASFDDCLYFHKVNGNKVQVIGIWPNGSVDYSSYQSYIKPSDGIPKTDLASAVQTSLGKADTALQSYTETDPVYSASAAAGITSSDISNWNSKTSNVGTITGITMNGSSKGTSGVVNLGTVVTSETDPVFTASAAAGITSSDITSWNNKVSNVQSDWNATTGAAVILNKPTIPAAPGTLKTNNTTAQTASASEALSGTINLHKVAKTGTYSDLIGTPTIPTESTVSGWGFTKNSGTVTGVKMNGTTKTPTSGTVDLGTVITSETSLSKGTTTGSGNAVTDISVSGHKITLTKGSTFLTSETQLSKGTTSGSGNVVTDLSVSGHTVTLTKGSNVPVATSANAGKIPMITSSGGWEYVTPSAIYSGSAAPNNNTGNNGDIYLQTS